MIRCFLLGALLLMAAWPTHAAKHALLVGVTELEHGPTARWLRGPANDVVALRQILVEKYGFAPENVTVLEGRATTRAGIERAFRDKLIAPVRAGDLAFFYFSGHGTQVDDVTPLDEADHLDEALVPFDAHGVETLILDDQLGQWLARVPTQEMVVMLDACHSGTGTRGGAVAKYIGPQELGIVVKNRTRGDGGPASADTVASDLTGPTVLSAAQATQKAADYPFLAGQGENANPYMGALTFYALKALRDDGSFALSYEEVFQNIGAALRRDSFDQTPQLEGFTRRRVFLLPGETPRIPTTTNNAAMASTGARVTQVQGAVAKVESLGGTLLTEGSVFEVAPDKDWRVADADPEPVGNVRATLRLTSVSGAAASAQIVNGTIKSGARLLETFHAFTATKLRVALLNKNRAVGFDELRQRIGALGYAQIVPETAPHDAEIEVETNAGGLRLAPFRNQLALPPIEAATPGDALLKLGAALENLYLIKQLLALENPAVGFKANVRVNGGKTAEIAIGDLVNFTVQVERDAYVYLLDVDPAGKITVLFPNKWVPDNLLKAGQVYPMPAPALYKMRVSGPAGPEAVKLIASAAPLQLPVLDNNGQLQPLGHSATMFVRNLLEQLQRGLNKGIALEAAAPAAISTKGWAADSVFLQIRP